MNRKQLPDSKQNDWAGATRNARRKVLFDSANSRIRDCNAMTAELEASGIGGPEDEWLTCTQAAEFLKVPEGSLRNMTSNGRLPYSKLGGRVRYSRKLLSRFLLQNAKGPAP